MRTKTVITVQYLFDKSEQLFRNAMILYDLKFERGCSLRDECRVTGSKQ